MTSEVFLRVPDQRAILVFATVLIGDFEIADQADGRSKHREAALEVLLPSMIRKNLHLPFGVMKGSVDAEVMIQITSRILSSATSRTIFMASF